MVTLLLIEESPFRRSILSGEGGFCVVDIRPIQADIPPERPRSVIQDDEVGQSAMRKSEQGRNKATLGHAGQGSDKGHSAEATINPQKDHAQSCRTNEVGQTVMRKSE
jgi:hypothetical protein